MENLPGIRLGTSAFTAAGWETAFYPAGMKPADYLTYYSTQFDAVELDNTFYRTPSIATVRGWYAKTPKNFIFAAKIPQVITHEKALRGAEGDLAAFLNVMDALGEKLGPLLFQFGYFNKKAFASVDAFLARLEPFLDKLPKDHRFAVEIRKKYWLVPKFVDALRSRKVALALVDQVWMPRPAELFAKMDPITADFTYVRWLGDRKGIEEKTKTWDKVIVDRLQDLENWVEVLRKVHKRKIQILAFANNHYAGFGPKTVEMFRTLWEK
ncbi:MAG TPA: DUF72 domain-containing protein [Candidatus Acidoferrum sp.]|nr:DUF72 domain-containing protein [Candidatus Acidoferrum sp.]